MVCSKLLIGVNKLTNLFGLVSSVSMEKLIEPCRLQLAVASLTFLPFLLLGFISSFRLVSKSVSLSFTRLNLAIFLSKAWASDLRFFDIRNLEISFILNFFLLTYLVVIIEKVLIPGRFGHENAND